MKSRGVRFGAMKGSRNGWGKWVRSEIKCRPDGPRREHRIAVKGVTGATGHGFHVQSTEFVPGAV